MEIASDAMGESVRSFQESLNARRVHCTVSNDAKQEHFKSMLRNVEAEVLDAPWTLEYRSLSCPTTKTFTLMAPNDDMNYMAWIQLLILMDMMRNLRTMQSFDYSENKRWHLADALLSVNGIPPPRPRFAISFAHDSIVGDNARSFPPQFSPWLIPEYTSGCLPFFFIETPTDGYLDFKNATLKNLHSASQALNHVYKLMESVGATDEFFQTVRVFSCVIGMEEVVLNVHRGICSKEGGLEFGYMTLARSELDYTYLFVEEIVTRFATEELLPIYKDLYKKINE